MNSLIFIGVVLLFSLLKWLFQQISAQAEKRRQQQEVERQQLEGLRTGRVSTSISDQAPLSQQRDSEEQRREELAELRRRAASRRAPQAGSSRPPRELPQALEILLGLPPGTTTGGTVPLPPRRQRPASKSRDKSRALKPQRPQATGAQPDPEFEAQRRAQIRRNADQENAAAEIRRQQEASERLRAQERSRAAANRAQGLDQRLLRDAKPVANTGALSPGNFVPRNAAEWRRTIAMNEVLGKPVSMR